MLLDINVQSLESVAPLLLIAAGVMMLIIGNRCLNAAVGLTGFLIGWTACRSALVLPVARAWLPETPVYSVLSCLLAGLLVAAIARRSNMIRRWMEIAGTVLACLLFFKTIMVLFGPTGGWVVIAVAVFSAIFSRSALIGCFAGVLLIAGVNPVAPEHAIGVVVVSIVIAWVRFGGLAGEPIPLRSGGGSRNLGLEQHAAPGYLEVVLAYDDALHASRSHARCTKRGRQSRLYDGLPGFVTVQLTRAEAVSMQRFSTAMSLVAPMPRMMADAETPIRLEVPHDSQTEAPPITPEEIADRLRTGAKGRQLSGRGSGGEGAIIAVIDSGINERANRDLTDRIIHAEGFVPHEPGHDDLTDSQHGSNVLRIIAACAPRAKFIVLKVFDQNGTSTFKQFLEALDAFVHRDATVANFSGGHAGCRGLDKCISCHAVNRVGKPFVGSAGNAGSNGLSCPGAASHAIGVAAGDANIPSRIADFSSRGPSAAPGVNPNPNVTAIGVNIQLKDRAGQVKGMNGTSFSAPQVSAGVAVVEAYARARNRSMTPRDLVRCVCESANPAAIASTDRDSNAMGSGMVNISRACHHAVPETPRAIRDLFRVARALPRAAAAVLAMILLPTSLGAGWWFGLDHVGTLKSARSAERVTMFGRIHDGTDSLLILDDGTGWVQIDWVGGNPDPIAGSIVLIQGTMAAASAPVLADWSWSVWRPQQSANFLHGDQSVAKRVGGAPYFFREARGMVASGGCGGHLAPHARDGRTGGLDG